MFSGDNLKIDKLVIGGSVEALWYAFCMDLPLVYFRPIHPFYFERLENIYEIPALKLSEKVLMKTQDAHVEEGILKDKIWQRLIFLLSMSGRNPFGDNAVSASIDDNIMSVNFGIKKKVNIEFKKLIIFDSEGVTGLPPPTKVIKNKSYVYDWMNIVSGGKHEYDMFLFDDDLVNKVYFYSSFRLDNHKVKDLVCLSRVPYEEIDHYSYSDTYAKLKLTKIMKGLGMRGARNGRDQENPDKYKYYAVTIEPTYRETKNDIINIYDQDDDRFLFLNEKIENMLDMPVEYTGYLKKLTESFL